MKNSDLSKLAAELIRIEAHESPEKATVSFLRIYDLENNDLKRLLTLFPAKLEEYKKSLIALWKKIDPDVLKQNVGDASFDYSDRSTETLRRMEKNMLLARDTCLEMRAIVRILQRIACTGELLEKDIIKPDEEIRSRVESAQSEIEVTQLELGILARMNSILVETLDPRLSHVQQLLNQRPPSEEA